MFTTILSGQVSRENWNKLQQDYEKLFKAVPEGVTQTYLLQDNDHPTLWKVVTFWVSEDSYKAAHEAKKTDVCEVLFCDAGTIPDRKYFHARRSFQKV
jgi:hypothetical protein